jgi:hypothetical protein
MMIAVALTRAALSIMKPLRFLLPQTLSFAIRVIGSTFPRLSSG